MDKPDPVTKLFAVRMEREGRAAEFRARIKAVMAADGSTFTPARYKVMREFGYVSPKEERKIDAEFRRTAQAAVEKKVEEKIFGEVREEKRILDFEQSLIGLPANASPAVELDWVRAHPALCRLARMEGEKKEVVITADDVLRAPHGKAPSRAAVNMLQDAANRPAKFHDAVTGELKKRMDAGDDTESQGAKADLSLQEIKSYLGQIKV
jgi:hypothetical protein